MAVTTPRATFLPFALPDIGEEEVAAVSHALRSGWITTGPETKAFEAEFAAFVGVKHAVAVNSCTAALHLGLEALGVGRGDEVLTTTLTFTATAEVAEYLGARTRFLDVDRRSLNLTPEIVRAAIETGYRRDGKRWVHKESGGRLAAIVPVHYAGEPCDMPGLVALGEEFGVPVLDDAAHSFPARVGGKHVGQWGNASAWSFYATKTITTAEGGMLTTDDDQVAQRVRMMALHGISRDAWKRYTAEGSWFYEVHEAGYKYNLTDLASALGRVQLGRAQQMADRRLALAAKFDAALAEVEQVETPQVHPDRLHARHLYPIRLRLDRLRIDRSKFIEELKARKVGASVHFIPLHKQPFYADKYGYRPADFPVAEGEYPRLVSLPLFSKMSDADADDVLGAVAEVARAYSA
jgi:dTDP-4-amino-4,6-dideoxygalactose transaminase